MARRTILITENDSLAQIIACCPKALRVLEKYFGRDLLLRNDLEKISLSSAVVLKRHQLHPLLIELNRICL